MNEVLDQLKEMNINLDGEEYYAVLGAYLNKIAELEGEKSVNISSLLRRAGEGAEGLEKSLADSTSNKNVCKILSSKLSQGEKVILLHDEAVNLGCQRNYQETFSKCRKFGQVHEMIEGSKQRYGRGYEDYKMLMNIKNDESSLINMIKMRAGAVNTPIEEIKKVVLDNISAQEEEFIKLQTNFVGRVVSFLVDDECRLVKEQESAQIS